MKILLTNEAEIHIANSLNFYGSQKEGLGTYFLDSISSDIESLHIYYGIHNKIKNYHRVLSKRFPYAIYYKYDQSTIYIYAVLDCRSNPQNVDYVLK
jgi:hypothetical protein